MWLASLRGHAGHTDSLIREENSLIRDAGRSPGMRHDQHMSWSPLRITNVWVKVAYFAAWLVVGQVLRIAMGWAPAWLSVAVIQIAWLVWILVATRSFRVAEEPIAPPRPWWKATGRPKASF